MSRLYADEHIPALVVHKLRLLGHDVLTVKQTNQNKYGDSVPDEQVLAFATLDNRAVLTLNRSDFQKLHQQFPGHRGILAAKRIDNWRALAKLIDAAIKAVIRERGKLDGQFVRIPFLESDESRPVPVKKPHRKG